MSDEEYNLAPVLTVEEAALFLRVNPKTLYESIRAGQVPAKTVGKRVLIFRDSLLDLK